MLPCASRQRPPNIGFSPMSSRPRPPRARGRRAVRRRPCRLLPSSHRLVLVPRVDAGHQRPPRATGATTDTTAAPRRTAAALVRTTPFHERTSALNQTQLWSHWSNYLAADRYQLSDKAEYFAVRNAAGIFDTSPALQVPDHGARRRGASSPACWPATSAPAAPGQRAVHVLARRARLRHRGRRHPAPAARRVPADQRRAQPRLVRRPHRAAGRAHRGGQRRDWGRSRCRARGRATCSRGWSRRSSACRTSASSRPRSAAPRCTVSRTGFTGDLGYELWVGAADALPVWDALWERAQGYGVQPFGLAALRMLRIEAGLLMLDADFDSSRYAWNDAHRSTPIELGWGWMFRDLEGDDRAFIGRRALERELAERTSRWAMRGLVVDWQDYDRVYTEAGLIPPKDHTPVVEDRWSTTTTRRRVGYATSFMYSPDAAAPHRARPRAPRPGRARHAREARVHRRPPLRAGRRARRPAAALQPRAKDGRDDDETTATDLRRHRRRRRPQRPGQRRLPRQGRPAAP